MRTALLLLTTCLSLPASAGGWEGRDLDGDGRADAVHVAAQNLTWLRDANAAAGSAFDNGLSPVDGRMTLAAATFWVDTLAVGGTAGWRLPGMTDLATPGCNFAFAGSDCGYNVDTASSELAWMFYAGLGNLGAYTAGGAARAGVSGTDFGRVHTGPFERLANDAYWIGEPYAPLSTQNWAFYTYLGRQGPISDRAELLAWAVHDGDVGAAVPVPEPATGLLGLLGLAVVAGRVPGRWWSLRRIDRR